MAPLSNLKLVLTWHGVARGNAGGEGSFEFWRIFERTEDLGKIDFYWKSRSLFNANKIIGVIKNDRFMIQ